MILTESDSMTADEVNTSSISMQYKVYFAHTVQLCLKDGFKEAGQLSKMLTKVANLVFHVHKSTIVTNLLEGEKKL